MKQVTARVIKNEQILKGLERRRDIDRPHPRDIAGSWLIWLRCPEIAREARPGQFVMVRCEGECVLPRPFSIHQVNEKGDIALFYAVWEDGKGTGWLSQREAGDKITVFGPLGNGFSICPTSHNLLLVAGGIGIAPLPFLADRAKSQGYSVKGVRGADTAGQLLPDAFLPHVQVVWPAATTLVGDPGTIKGVVIDLLPEYIDWADQVFACGPSAMYRDMAVRKQELRLEGKPVQVSLEIVMGCGRGVCYGCTIKTKQGQKLVCEDGPVFDLDDVLWDELSV